jgi:tyrosyl-tRNA synthetase
MTSFKSEFLNVLQSRGFIHQISDPEALDELAAAGPITGYIGFDATATSLHVGHLTQIMMLHWMQQTGHRPIALMGGGTSMIGDPSFKDEARKLLTVQDIEHNLLGIRRSFGRYLKFAERGGRAIMANNADWLLDINYVEFLRDVGRHFSVNRMLSFDSVKLRLDREQSLSFLEFNYMILQAYDFAELNKRYGCVLQMGGSDQWGNIVSGIDLGRRLNNAHLFALTSPLLTTASGAKMGKTASGAVWLNEELMSPYEFWQYWRKTEDADVTKFLKLFTTIPVEEIDRLELSSGTEINEAKKHLATEVTAMLHGREAALAAAETARKTFEEGVIGDELRSISVTREQLEQGYSISNANTALQFSRSNGEARKQIESGAVKLGGQKVVDIHLRITLENFDSKGQLLVETGKNKKGVIKLIDPE